MALNKAILQMKPTIILTCLTLGAFCVSGFAQPSVRDYAVELEAMISTNPAQISLFWPADTTATEFAVFKRTANDKTWTDSVLLTGKDTSWTDRDVEIAQGYEYQVRKTAILKPASTEVYKAYGYIYTGIQMPMVENRGKLILLIAENLRPDLDEEIQQLQSDMMADGWIVLPMSVGLNATVSDVKKIIVALYEADPKNVKALLMLGHIAVPYSGGIAMDGHDQEHGGAWPADLYYGDIDGEWTDEDVQDTTAPRKENDNVVGDGKFDQDIIPSDIELSVGRIDLSHLPVFENKAGMSEIDLMKRYLMKNHAYRSGQFSVKEKALIKDNFGTLGGESFSATAFKNFSPIVGRKNILVSDWKTHITTDTFLWSYGAGGGTFTSASGIITSNEFADTGVSYNTVFTNLFGSYFGDWDSEDNLLRAALASPGMILTTVWSGRPQWLFHHMALGETIGYSTNVSQNQYALYFRSTRLLPHHRVTTPALMGDPTLRLHVVLPPGLLTVTSLQGGQSLHWSPSKAPNVLGYYVYRTNGPDKPFIRLNANPITDTTYFDGVKGNFLYMVRAVVLQMTPSGSYYNLSPGSTNPSTLPSGIKKSNPVVKKLSVYPNPSNRFVNIETGTVGEIVFVNILGQEVRREKINQKIVVDVQSMTKGLYLLLQQQNGALVATGTLFVE